MPLWLVSASFVQVTCGGGDNDSGDDSGEDDDVQNVMTITIVVKMVILMEILMMTMKTTIVTADKKNYVAQAILPLPMKREKYKILPILTK